MCTVMLFKVVGTPDISCSLVVRFHGGFVDTGYLAFTLHMTVALHSAVSCGVYWLRCIALVEEPPVVRLNDGLHIHCTIVRKLYGVLVADRVQWGA